MSAQVNGFTGSSIWHLLYSFPPNDFERVEAGYRDFAERWGPILDVFEAEGVRYGLEVHPTEIAYDFVTTRKALEAIDRRESFGINFDESLRPPVPGLGGVRPGVRRPHLPRPRQGLEEDLDGRSSILGGHLNFGEVGRGWDFVSPGHGDVDFESLFRALNRIGYEGRSRSSGRMPAWIANGAPRTRWRSSAERLHPVHARVRRGLREELRMDETEVGFLTMGRAGGPTELQTIGIGMLGYAFMEGPRERLPEDRVHDVAATPAATARRRLREDGGGGRGGGAPLRL